MTTICHVLISLFVASALVFFIRMYFYRKLNKEKPKIQLDKNPKPDPDHIARMKKTMERYRDSLRETRQNLWATIITVNGIIFTLLPIFSNDIHIKNLKVILTSSTMMFAFWSSCLLIINFKEQADSERKQYQVFHNASNAYLYEIKDLDEFVKDNTNSGNKRIANLNTSLTVLLIEGILLMLLYIFSLID